MNELEPEKIFEVTYTSYAGGVPGGTPMRRRVTALYYQLDKEWITFKDNRHKPVLLFSARLVECIEEVRG